MSQAPLQLPEWGEVRLLPLLMVRAVVARICHDRCALDSAEPPRYSRHVSACSCLARASWNLGGAVLLIAQHGVG